MTHRRTVTEADIVNFAGIQRRLLLRAHGRHRGEGVDLRAPRRARVLRAVSRGGAVRGSGARTRAGELRARNLRFAKPVYTGDTIQAKLTCKQKTAKETQPGGVPQGVVAWDVEVTNQANEPVAVYTILTLVRRLNVAPSNGANVA